MTRFQPLPKDHKFTIGNVPDDGNDKTITVEAQWNPKELQIEMPIQWTSHGSIGAQAVATKPTEFSGMGAETMKIELTFDAFEQDDDSVVERIAALKEMASVQKHDRRSGKFERPGFCVATWGTQPPFRCVIESISVKYTMFSFDGTPVRAIVTLGLKSGRRSLDTAETAYERSSRERQEQLVAKRKERTHDRLEAERLRDEQYARDQEARRRNNEASTRLAEREGRAHAEQQQLAADREQREREVRARAERIELERRVAQQERDNAAERQRVAAERAQRKQDFDLE